MGLWIISQARARNPSFACEFTGEHGIQSATNGLTCRDLFQRIEPFPTRKKQGATPRPARDGSI